MSYVTEEQRKEMLAHPAWPYFNAACDSDPINYEWWLWFIAGWNSRDREPSIGQCVADVLNGIDD